MGRGPSTGPRAGSRPHTALVRLQALGGRLTLADWMRALEFAGKISSFERDVIASLTRYRLIGVDGPLFSITRSGLDELGIPVGASVPAAPALVAPRYTVPIRDLDLKRHMPRRMLAREGAMDYRNIPSVMFGERIPYSSVLAGDKR
jgi:hypothetical protein